MQGRAVHELTTAQIEKLLAFRGYGNPSGRFWFVGMEEGGSSEIESLQIRADNFSPLEDLAESHKNFPTHDMSKLTTSTWGLMSSIVGRFTGEVDWWSSDFRRTYQVNRLGRHDGETYLTEVLPLPKRSLSEWPYGNNFNSPDDYFEKIFPSQASVIRKDYEEANPKPQFVICYGKSYWRYHREIFDFVHFKSAPDGTIQWGRNDDTVFLLTNFLDYGRMGFTAEFVDDLCEFALSKSINSS